MFGCFGKEQRKPVISLVKGADHDVEAKFLHRIFEESLYVPGTNDKKALIYKDANVPSRDTTYVDLNQRANQMANIIIETVRSQKLKPNQDGDFIVSVCMRPSDNLIFVLLSIWKAGAAYLPIDVKFPKNRIEHILSESKAVMVIYDDSYQNSKFFSSSHAIKFSDLRKESEKMSAINIPDQLTLTEGNPDSMALMLYTSGSTGIPKGVRLRHHTVQHRIEWQKAAFPFTETETYCVFKTAMIFVDHIGEVWTPLFCGKTLVVVPKEVVKDPERFVPILQDYKIERLIAVPTLLRSILIFLTMLENNRNRYILSSLRLWMSSGEPLTVQLAQEFFNYYIDGHHTLANFYGCTEVTADVCVYELKSKRQMSTLDRIPLGSPVHNTNIYLLDDEMNIVDEGDIGELCVTGVMVSDGYINKRDQHVIVPNKHDNDQKFSRLYKTGDYATLKEGVLFSEGRRDMQIKIRGHRVDLSEVEIAVSELQYVERSSILVYHAGQIDQALLAFVVNEKVFGKTIVKTDSQVENDLKDKLPEYMLPQVIVLEEFPYLPNGKVDRQTLLKIYEIIAVKEKKEVLMEIDYKNIPKEKLDIAKKIFEVVGNSLGTQLRNKLSIDANFFDLGGNSMNSIYTVSKLREKGYFIGITEFLKAENLGEVLDKITSTKKPKTDDMRVIRHDKKLLREPINIIEKDACIEIIAQSFLHKADLDQYIPDVKKEYYYEFLSPIWEFMIQKELSFMVKDDQGKLIGVSLNFDAHDEPSIVPKNALIVTFDFLNSLETPIIENQLPKGLNQVIHTFMMGTAQDLSSKQNIMTMHFMEQEVIRLATEKKFQGILTTNTNPLTQQFGETVFGYNKMLEYQIKNYCDKEGQRPFITAPETQKVVIMYKSLK